MVHNRGHGAQQGMLPLLDGINKPFCCINFLLDKKNCFFLTPVFFVVIRWLVEPKAPTTDGKQITAAPLPNGATSETPVSTATSSH